MEDIFKSGKLQRPELSLLSLDDIQGENKLEVIDKYGLLAELSDLSLVGETTINSNILEKKSSKYCGYVTGSINYELKDPAPYYVSADEKIRCADGLSETGILGSYLCTRLVLKNIPIYILDYITSNKRINSKGVCEVELGEFFLKEVDRTTKNKLNVYANKNDKLYRFKLFNDKSAYAIWDGNPIYDFEGKYYIRYGGNDREYRWFESIPIVWLIDEKTNTLVSKNTFFSVRSYDILNGDYEQYMEEKMIYEMFSDMLMIYDKFIEKENERKKNQRFYVRFIKWLKSIFYGNNTKELPSTSSTNLVPASSNNLAKIDAAPSKDKVSDIKSEEKNEEKLEINNKEINGLCDYIKEKSLLLVPTKSKEVLERLKQLLDTHEREVKDLDSEMYIKYNLTLMTYEDSRLNLWRGLSSLKVEVDSLLKDTNNILNYGEEYVIYLRNCVEKYQSLSYGDLSGDGAINNLVNLVKKIDGEYDKTFPYYRDEILKLIFLSIHFLIEINPYSIDSYVGYHKEGIDELQILDKLITWFDLYFLTNKDKLSSELQAKYYNIKMTMSKDNKFAYIVELAKIIDTTLLLEENNDKKK